MLDHVKGKVVEPAKAPDRDREQQNGLYTLMLIDQQQSRKNSDHQEKDSLELDPIRILKLFHSKSPITDHASRFTHPLRNTEY